MIYIFDKDRTLVGGPSGRPANTAEEQTLLPNVAEKIAALRSQGHKIALASNQGGVAWGFISFEQAQALMDDCAAKIGGVDAMRFSPFDPRAAARNPYSPFARDDESRKPYPGMIISIMQELGANPNKTIFVGDADSDMQAAQNAGVKFEWAKDFFNA